MAEFCKIRNGAYIKAPNPLRITVVNPSDERYRYEGYLEMRYTEPPAHDPETQELIETWVQDGQSAVQSWTVRDKHEGAAENG